MILEDTSFQFEQGKIYGLLGRNGAGKTTLFNCIARNLTLDSGSIQFVKAKKLLTTIIRTSALPRPIHNYLPL